MAVAEQANLDRVAPALHEALLARRLAGELPQDFLEYLGLIHAATLRQNARVHRLVLELGEILGAAGIPVLLLKGANRLMAAGGALGSRLLGDVDFLVAAKQEVPTLEALTHAGFRPAAAAALYARHFHHVPLARPGDPVTIELHRHLGWQRHLLTPAEAMAAAAPLAALPALRLMNPAHRFIFGCLHAQLQDMTYRAGLIRLRDLLDIAELANGEILDWQAIAAFGEERGIQAYLAGPLHLAHRLLGLPLPGPYRGMRAARHHARRCILQRRIDPGQRLARLGVKLAWLWDARRHAYERDCERSGWLRRQGAVMLGRIEAIRGVLGRANRKRAATFAAERG